MKKTSLLIAGFCLALAPTTLVRAGFADEKPKFGTVCSEGRASIEIYPVKGKPGEIGILLKNSNMLDLIQVLADRSGKKLSVDPSIKGGVRYLDARFHGTPKQIEAEIELQLTTFGIKFVVNDREWMVGPDPTPRKFVLPIGPLGPDEKLFMYRQANFPELEIPEVKPWGEPHSMNINPTPGKNLPENAVPFDFNGSRLYKVPIQKAPVI